MKENTGLEILSKVLGLGDSLRIDSPLTTGQPLVVDQIWEWSPPSLNPMVDYILANNAGDGSPMRLRIMRQESADRSKAAILTLYDRFPYSEQFNDVVRSDFKHLAVHDTDSEERDPSMFWRIRDAIESHVSPVKIRKRAGRPTHANVEFWDYSRLTDVNGVEAEEFIFVELNSADRAFEIWRGVEAPVEGY
ncbi:MAG: hypothetical protein KF873_20120 [Gemmataceae bacterium]|nr:hypothetical protein [Gemmataceae bacterium]